MKKTLFALFVASLLALETNAQTEAFIPGWYILQSGAQVKVVQGNSNDALSKTDWHLLNYGHNEVLMAFNFSKDKYYCYDPEGRIILVKGKASLEKISTAGRPAHLNEDVKIGLDFTLHTGHSVWLTGFNATAKTATILLTGGQKVEIPQSSLEDLKDHFDKMDKTIEWLTVE